MLAEGLKDYPGATPQQMDVLREVLGMLMCPSKYARVGYCLSASSDQACVDSFRKLDRYLAKAGWYAQSPCSWQQSCRMMLLDVCIAPVLPWSAGYQLDV